MLESLGAGGGVLLRLQPILLAYAYLFAKHHTRYHAVPFAKGALEKGLYLLSPFLLSSRLFSNS